MAGGAVPENGTRLLEGYLGLPSAAPWRESCQRKQHGGGHAPLFCSRRLYETGTPGRVIPNG